MDLLSVYAGSQPDKAAVIDDRPGHEVLRWTFAELDRRANQLGNHFSDLRAGPGTKIVWCGQNSAGVIAGVHAIRRVGGSGPASTTGLTPDEAAYVIDNSDAQIVYIDAEHSELVQSIRDRIPRVRELCVFAATAVWSVDLDSAASTSPMEEAPPP